jgi:hypothetical protein
VKSNEPKASPTPPDLQTMERELKNPRQVMQMHPGRSAEELKHLSDLERSARAEVKLRLKALESARNQQREAQDVPASD